MGGDHAPAAQRSRPGRVGWAVPAGDSLKLPPRPGSRFSSPKNKKNFQKGIAFRLLPCYTVCEGSDTGESVGSNPRSYVVTGRGDKQNGRQVE